MNQSGRNLARQQSAIDVKRVQRGDTKRQTLQNGADRGDPERTNPGQDHDHPHTA